MENSLSICQNIFSGLPARTGCAFLDLIKYFGLVDISQRMTLVSVDELIIFSMVSLSRGNIDDFNFICIDLASVTVIAKSSSFLTLQLVIISDAINK